MNDILEKIQELSCSYSVIMVFMFIKLREVRGKELWYKN